MEGGVKLFGAGTKSRSAGDTSKATAFENLGVGALKVVGRPCESADVASTLVRPMISVSRRAEATTALIFILSPSRKRRLSVVCTTQFAPVREMEERVVNPGPESLGKADALLRLAIDRETKTRA